MNEVVVGVQRIRQSSGVLPGEEANVAVKCYWVTIDGKEVPSESIISASTIAENGPLIVEIRVLASEFRTTDFNGPEAPERFRREE